MTTHYDTIIIGAGLSALAAGIRLSHYHKKVLILERHYLPGGLNSWYFFHGHYMDVGLHAVTNYTESSQRQAPLNKLLRQLRFKREDFDLYQQGFSTIDFPEVSLRFTNHPQDLEDDIAQKFPNQIDGFRLLKEKIISTDSLSLNAPYLSTRLIIGQFLTDPILIEMLLEPVMYYGSADENDIEFHQFCIMFQSLFMEGFWRPASGMKSFIETLVKRFKENGGELRLHAGVKSLNSQKERIVSLTLDSGEILTADNFLSCVGAKETLDLCHTSDHIISHPQGKLSYIESVFLLNKLPKEVGIESTISFFNQQNQFYYQSPTTLFDHRSGVLCAPNNFLIPTDEQPALSLRLTHLANYDLWCSLSEEAYRQNKNLIIEQQKEALCKKWPLLKGAFLETDLFTPKTIVRFTGHLNGAIYGSPKKLRDGRTPFTNLFICGTDQGFLGIVGSMLSGISMTNQWLLA